MIAIIWIIFPILRFFNIWTNIVSLDGWPIRVYVLGLRTIYVNIKLGLYATTTKIIIITTITFFKSVWNDP